MKKIVIKFVLIIIGIILLVDFVLSLFFSDFLFKDYLNTYYCHFSVKQLIELIIVTYTFHSNLLSKDATSKWSNFFNFFRVLKNISLIITLITLLFHFLLNHNDFRFLINSKTESVNVISAKIIIDTCYTEDDIEYIDTITKCQVEYSIKNKIIKKEVEAYDNEEAKKFLTASTEAPIKTERIFVGMEPTIYFFPELQYRKSTTVTLFFILIRVLLFLLLSFLIIKIGENTPDWMDDLLYIVIFLLSSWMLLAYLSI